MKYTNKHVAEAYERLKNEYSQLDDKRAILKSPEIKELYQQIRQIPVDLRKEFGKQVNQLKDEVTNWLDDNHTVQTEKSTIDVTAPRDVNVSWEQDMVGLFAAQGSLHPISIELANILDIFSRMGFSVLESRQIDDDYHMFEALNFPLGHPARDDYDTFMTEDGLIAPAHTSTMQNRILVAGKANLEKGQPIAVVVPGRVFRNEDLDVTHEHTFYQIEGVYVDKGVNVGNLIATLKTYMSEFFGQVLNIKIQPFYFPFTEPSFEFAIERPESMKKDGSEAEKWLEIGGCGLINSNVLKYAGIDSNTYTGFAFGFGVERMVMMKNGIEDVRHFESARLEFLRQFA